VRYVSVQTQAYSIRLRRNCVFHLTYEVMPWREGSERWCLVSAREVDSAHDVNSPSSGSQ
jgi:hypothetical protein